MKIEKKIEKQDYKLLALDLPDPCTKCHNSYACLGCPKKREWDELMKPVKDAGIFNIWQNVQEVRMLQREMCATQKKIKDIKKAVAEEGFDLNQVFREDWAVNDAALTDIKAF